VGFLAKMLTHFNVVVTRFCFAVIGTNGEFELRVVMKTPTVFITEFVHILSKIRMHDSGL